MKVAAFNVQKLGIKKVKDKDVCEHLIKIISQYDIVLLLEVLDQNGQAMELLMKKLNSDGEHTYKKIVSSPIGRKTYKERYVFIYRENDVEVKDQYQYEDDQVGDEDAFAREPFIVHFNCRTTVVKDLVLIPVHTKPKDAQKELDELYDVVEEIRKMWETDNIMLLGDFNADGHYLSQKKKKTIRICAPPFYWLIGDDVDTTASNNNDNTYDRIVVYGDTMKDGVVPESAKPFNFQTAFDLSDEQALHISDHYPVEVELKTAAKRKQAAEPKGPAKKKR